MRTERYKTLSGAVPINSSSNSNSSSSSSNSNNSNNTACGVYYDIYCGTHYRPRPIWVGRGYNFTSLSQLCSPWPITLYQIAV